MSHKAKNKIIDEHFLEVLFAIIVIVLSIISTRFGVNKNTALIVGICATLISINIAIIKMHVSIVSEKLMLQFEERIAKHNDLLQHISQLDGEALTCAKRHMDETASKLKDIKEGKIFLDQETYYEHINESMKNAASGSVVVAINCIDSLRWSKDANQVRYFKENINAAKRNVKIHRIFVIEKQNLIDDKEGDRVKNIKEHMDCDNIKIDIVWAEELIGFKSELEDMVIFQIPDRKLYVDFQDNPKRTNVSHAYLYLSEKAIDERLNVFKKLKNYRITDTDRKQYFGNLKGNDDRK